MKKYFLLALFLLTPFMASANTQVFGFLDGKFYDANATLRYACLLDGSCYDYSTQQITTLNSILGLSTSKQTTITITDNTPTPTPTPTPFVNPTPVFTPTPIITPTPVSTPTPIIAGGVPSYGQPVIEVSPASTVKQNFTNPYPRTAAIWIVRINANYTYPKNLWHWNTIDYSVISDTIQKNDIYPSCDTNLENPSTNLNCSGTAIIFYIKNYHPGTFQIVINGATLYDNKTGDAIPVTGVPLTSHSITFN